LFFHLARWQQVKRLRSCTLRRRNLEPSRLMPAGSIKTVTSRLKKPKES
jgi:hypothetical protein